MSCGLSTQPGEIGPRLRNCSPSSPLAVQRATSENLREMRQAVEEMDRNLGAAEDFIAADMGIHLALAKATQNAVYPLLIGTIVDALPESRRLVFGVPGATQRSQVWHRSVFDAVENGDTWTARNAMRNHLQQVA